MDIEMGYDEDSTTCDQCGDTDAEAYNFGRLGRQPLGTWGIVEVYTSVLCARCARQSGKVVA